MIVIFISWLYFIILILIDLNILLNLHIVLICYVHFTFTYIDCTSTTRSTCCYKKYHDYLFHDLLKRKLECWDDVFQSFWRPDDLPRASINKNLCRTRLHRYENLTLTHRLENLGNSFQTYLGLLFLSVSLLSSVIFIRVNVNHT